jgi:predicted nuclease of predicted toxin-antitoxin system
LITNDKDFGEMVFRERKLHSGVILLRLEDERPSNKIRVLEQLISRYGDQFVGNFVVANENAIRAIHIRNS